MLLVVGDAVLSYTANVLVTSAAALQFPSPACDATMVYSPAPLKVRILPLIFVPNAPPSFVKLTVSPDDAVALSVRLLLADGWAGIAGNDIV